MSSLSWISLGRSQVSAWFRTIAYISNMLEHLIDVVSILPQGARTRWFWILMTACLCRKCRPACVCLRDTFAGLTMNGENMRKLLCLQRFRWMADGHLDWICFFLKSSMLARGLRDLQEKILQLVFGSAHGYHSFFRLANTQLCASGTCGGIGVLDATEG